MRNSPSVQTKKTRSQPDRTQLPRDENARNRGAAGTARTGAPRGLQAELPGAAVLARAAWWSVRNSEQIAVRDAARSQSGAGESKLLQCHTPHANRRRTEGRSSPLSVRQANKFLTQRCCSSTKHPWSRHPTIRTCDAPLRAAMANAMHCYMLWAPTSSGRLTSTSGCPARRSRRRP